MTYKSVSCNVYAPGTAANNKRTIQMALAAGDVISFQEAQEATTRAVISQAPGFDAYLPTGLPSANPIAWRSKTHRLFDEPGWAKIMDNLPNVADGPDRSMTWAPLEEILTARYVLEVCLHMTAKAYTTHPERQPSWLTAAQNVGRTLHTLEEKYPDVPIVIKADWNRRTPFDIPSVIEQELESPPTFGNSRYDRFFLVGKVQGSDGVDIDTPSDHDALRVDITLLGKSVRKTVDQIVVEVLDGKWGNGIDRELRLTKAGYDYNAVQLAVIRKMNTPPIVVKPPVVVKPPAPKPTPKPPVDNPVSRWRSEVLKTTKMEFPSAKDRPAAARMKSAVDDAIEKALEVGPND